MTPTTPTAAPGVSVEAIHKDHLSIGMGAIYDFAGFLTTREKRITASMNDEAGPMGQALTEFFAKRGIKGDPHLAIHSWHVDPPPAPAGEPQGVTEADVHAACTQLSHAMNAGLTTAKSVRRVLESFAASRPVAGALPADWLPSMRNISLAQPELKDYGSGYQHGYTWGWNDCLRRIAEERVRTTKAGGAS